MPSHAARYHRLRPGLFDRLSSTGAKAAANDEKGGSGPASVVSVRQYRSGVLQDLSRLLNSAALPRDEQIEDWPHAAASVVNWGLPDLAPWGLAGGDDRAVERALILAITRFEPRLRPASVRVRVRRRISETDAARASTADGAETGPWRLEVEIEAELCGTPVPEHLYLRTLIDVGTSRCTLRER